MKATLEFDLTLPEERSELDHALKGSKFAAFIHDFNEELRRIGKYEILNKDFGSVSETTEKMFSTIRRAFFDLLEDYDIDLEKDL